MSDTLTTVTEALRKEIVIMREDDERKSAQFKRRIDELTEEQRLTNEKLTTTIIELNKSNRRSEEQAAQIDEQTKQIAALTSAVAESSHGIDLLVAQIEALNLVPAYKKNSR
jgi:chromosome segregation ATPase